jgi:hypothetical protein
MADIGKGRPVACRAGPPNMPKKTRCGRRGTSATASLQSLTDGKVRIRYFDAVFVLI